MLIYTNGFIKVSFISVFVCVRECYMGAQPAVSLFKGNGLITFSPLDASVQNSSAVLYIPKQDQS